MRLKVSSANWLPLTTISTMLMMTSSNGNIFRDTGPLCGDFTGHRLIPRRKATDVEIWCFLWSAPWTNGWVSTREAGDLIRHRAHYDVIVMYYMCDIYTSTMRADSHDSEAWWLLVARDSSPGNGEPRRGETSVLPCRKDSNISWYHKQVIAISTQYFLV